MSIIALEWATSNYQKVRTLRRQETPTPNTMDNYQLSASFKILDADCGKVPYVIERDGDYIVLKTIDNPDPLFIHLKAAVLIAEAINQLAKVKS